MNCFNVNIKCKFDFSPTIRFVCLVSKKNKIKWYVDQPMEFAYDEVNIIKTALLSSSADWHIDAVEGLNINPINGGVTDKGRISFNVLTVNEDLDKEYIVSAIHKDVKADLPIIHYGRREIFNASEGIFTLADGGTFNVIK